MNKNGNERDRVNNCVGPLQPTLPPSSVDSFSEKTSFKSVNRADSEVQSW